MVSLSTFLVAGGTPVASSSQHPPVPARAVLSARPSFRQVRSSVHPFSAAAPSFPRRSRRLLFRRSRGPSVGGRPNHALQRTEAGRQVFSAIYALRGQPLSLSLSSLGHKHRDMQNPLVNRSLFYWQVFLCALCISFCACSQTPEKAILGKWKDMDQGLTWEFLKDGIFLFSNSQGEISPGRYKFIDSTRIKIDADRPHTNSDHFVGPVAIEGEKMDVTIPGAGGGTIHFQRVK